MRLVRSLIYVLAALAGLYLLAAVLYAIPMVSGALDDTMEVRLSRADPSIVADYRNGLTPGQRETFYHLSQGSEIMPWILLTAVDVADPGSTKPFVENLERYGLLPDPARKDGLPVGLTVTSNPFTFGMDFVGVTCAACHVGELRYDGKAVRVDGAPNMFNLQLFYSQAVDALTATMGDRGKLWRALKRLGRQDYERYGVAAPFVRPATLVVLRREHPVAPRQVGCTARTNRRHPRRQGPKESRAPDVRLWPAGRLRRHPQLHLHAPAQGGRGRRFRGQQGEHGHARRGGEVPAALVAQSFGRRNQSRPTASNPSVSRPSGVSRITTGSNGLSTLTR